MSLLEQMMERTAKVGGKVTRMELELCKFCGSIIVHVNLTDRRHGPMRTESLRICDKAINQQNRNDA